MVYMVIPRTTPVTRIVHCLMVVLLILMIICVLMFAIMVEDMIHMETYSVEHVSNHAQQINIQLLIPIHDYANQDALS